MKTTTRKCQVCGGALTGRQKVACSLSCASKKADRKTPAKSRAMRGNTNLGPRSYKYVAVHERMNRAFPRTGRCEYCGRRKKTEYASIDHRYTENRADWFELCRKCHIAFDERPQKQWPRP